MERKCQNSEGGRRHWRRRGRGEKQKSLKVSMEGGNSPRVEAANESTHQLERTKNALEEQRSPDCDVTWGRIIIKGGGVGVNNYPR